MINNTITKDGSVYKGSITMIKKPENKDAYIKDLENRVNYLEEENKLLSEALKIQEELIQNTAHYNHYVKMKKTLDDIYSDIATLRGG